MKSEVLSVVFRILDNCDCGEILSDHVDFDDGCFKFKLIDVEFELDEHGSVNCF